MSDPLTWFQNRMAVFAALDPLDIAPPTPPGAVRRPVPPWKRPTVRQALNARRRAMRERALFRRAVPPYVGFGVHFTTGADFAD